MKTSLPASYPAASMPSTSAARASRLESRSGANPPSSPTAVFRPRLFRMPLRAWKTSVPIRRASGEGRRAGGDDHELLEVDGVVRVRAAVQDVHHRHRQHARAGRAGHARDVRVKGLHPRQRPTRWPRRARRPGWRLLPGATCSGCRQGRSSPGRSPLDPKRRRRSSASAISPFAFATAFMTPLPSHAAPPSRSSVASNSPVEAPEGTAARPIAPPTSVTSASTVGLPLRVEDLARFDAFDLGHAKRRPAALLGATGTGRRF